MAFKDDSVPYMLEEPATIAQKYGGNKQKIAAAAQQGIIDPTAAVLAGMFIDQMRTAATQEQVPQQTVAQQVFAPPAPAPVAPAGLMAAPGAQSAPPIPAPPPQAAAPQAPMPMMADGGLMDLDVPDDMYDDSYANGGIVAFSAGDSIGLGNTFDPYSQMLEPILDPRTKEEREREYAEQLYRESQQKMRDVFSGKVPLDKRLAEPRIGAEGARLLEAQDAARPPLPTAKPPVSPALAAKPAATTAAPTRTAAPAPAPAAADIPKPMSVDEFKKHLSEFGVNDEWKKKYEDLISKTRETGGDRDMAKNMALLQAGLGIMSGTSQYALQNIGEGSKAAIAQYGKDIKEIRAAERDANKMEAELAKAEDAQRRGDFKAYQEHTDRAKKYALDVQEYQLKQEKLAVDREVAQAQKAHWAKPSPFREQYDIYVADERAAGRTPSFEGFRKSLGTGDETMNLNRIRYAQDALAKNLSYLQLSTSPKPKDQAEAAKIERKTYAHFGAIPMGGGATPPQAAIDALKSNPALAAQFEAKYGAGTAAQYLGR